MGDKKKKRDKSRSEDKKKKSKKTKSDKNKDKQKKKKNQKRPRSSSRSSSSSSNSSEERSRKKDQKFSKIGRDKSTDKPKAQSIQLPFQIGAKSMIPPVSTPINPIRPGMMPPPVAPPAAVVSSNKPKTKQYHVFKLLPKLPIGCVTIGKTLYSSQFLPAGFQQSMFISLSEEVQKSAKAEGSKKMASLMNKVRTQISSLEPQEKQDTKVGNQKFTNQFSAVDETYQREKTQLKEQLLSKSKKIISY